MRVVGTLRKNKPEIPALLLSGKQRDVHASVFDFTRDQTLVSYVPARRKIVIHLSLQHYDNMCMGEEKDHKPEIVMQYNATESGVDILYKLVREYTCTRSTRHWPLKLFFNLIDVACVNAFVLWMLKYPNWQRKKNNCRRLYLLRLGEEMVTPYVRRRADSGNMDRNTCSAMRAMDVACKQPVSTTNVKKDGGIWCGRCCICPTAKD